MDSSSYDVIIVGGGISGLTAAYNIKKKDPTASVIVLEANDRVGGRTHTVPMAAASGSDKWDVGGQWVGSSQVHVMELLKELGLDTYRQYAEGKRVQHIGGKFKTFTGTIPALSIISLLDLQQVMMRTEYLQKQLNPLDPWSHPKAEEWDSISAGNYLDQVVYTQDGRESIDAAMRTIYGCEPSQISFLYHLLYVHKAGSMEALIEDFEGTAQEAKIVGGAQQISLQLSSKIGKDSLKLNEPVLSITQNDTDVTVVTKTGWTGTASRVVLAIPPKAIERIDFTPQLSRDRVDFMKHMPMGNYIKLIITYEKAFWRSKGYSGVLISSGHPLKGIDGMAPFSVAYDATSINGNPALVGFISGEMAMQWAMRPAKERQNAVLEHLAVAFGKEALTFIDYREKDWNQEPYTHGGPISFMNVGGMKQFTQSLQRVEGRIHFAGTETASVWTGYMSGAVEAGERCALEVLSHLRPGLLSQDDTQRLAALEELKRNIGQWKKKAGKSVFRTLFWLSVGVAACSSAAYALSNYLQIEIEKLIPMPQ